MSAPSTVQPSYGAPSFYAHSGRIPIAGTITALGVGIFVGSVLAFIYAFLDLYIPIIGIVTILLLIGLVVGIGQTLAWMFRWAQIRSLKAAAVLSVIVAVITLYMSWVGWEIAIFTREEGAHPSMLLLILEPWIVFQLGAEISRVGAWSIGSSAEPVRGVPLLVVWAIEALVILIAIPRIALAKLKEMSFCESCLKWCHDRIGVTRFAASTDAATLRQQIVSGDLESIAKHERADAATPRHYRVDLFRCPACDGSHMLSVTDVSVGVDSKGNQSITARPVVDRMYITSDWAEWITATAEHAREEVKETFTPADEASAPSIEDAADEARSDDAVDRSAHRA